jgi:hypothetical protein
MARFCAFYPWCSPDVFWRLDLDEYLALAAVIDEVAAKKG